MLVAGLADERCQVTQLILSNNDLGSASGVLLGHMLAKNSYVGAVARPHRRCAAMVPANTRATP